MRGGSDQVASEAVAAGSTKAPPFACEPTQNSCEKPSGDVRDEDLVKEGLRGLLSKLFSSMRKLLWMFGVAYSLRMVGWTQVL